MQLCSEKQMPEFEVIDFKIDLSDTSNEQKSIDCCGVVVNCQQEKGSSMYRVWVKFMDMSEKDQESIRKMAKHSRLLCPYCENF
ncbi:MAG: PilZ domain-containing protein [Lentisphaerota bacterium]